MWELNAGFRKKQCLIGSLPLYLEARFQSIGLTFANTGRQFERSDTSPFAGLLYELMTTRFSERQSQGSLVFPSDVRLESF